MKLSLSCGVSELRFFRWLLRVARFPELLYVRTDDHMDRGYGASCVLAGINE